MMGIKTKISELIHEYDNLSKEIESVRKYQSWKNDFIFRYLDILHEDPTTMDEWKKDKYDHLIEIYKRSKAMINDLHLKANRLKTEGMDGELVEKALRTNVESVLERRIPAEFRELPTEGN